METTKQISVFSENKPGRLAKVLQALYREKINVVALTVMDSHEHSVLRLVSDDPAKTREVAKTLGTPVAETEVLLVELRNQPGSLAHVCELLGSEHINIDYAYCSSGGRQGKTLGVFKVSNAEKAMRVLSEPNGSTGRSRTERRPPRDRRSYQLR